LVESHWHWALKIYYFNHVPGSSVAIIAATKEEISSAANAAAATAVSAAPAAAGPEVASVSALPAGVGQISMPALSSTMKEGKIVQWTKSIGDRSHLSQVELEKCKVMVVGMDRVEAGDIVMVVESDKADMDVEAFESGFLAKILVPEGSSGLVGSAVALLVQVRRPRALVLACLRDIGCIVYTHGMFDFPWQMIS
jgi:biotin carboxyl carrier protein